MSLSADQLAESALALPQAARADLALQLLQSLTPPGDAVSSEQFGRQLRERVEKHREGQLDSLPVEDARAAIRKRLDESRNQ
ncbi:MAG: addiction module protein [Planctomycetota bacterium]